MYFICASTCLYGSNVPYHLERIQARADAFASRVQPIIASIQAAGASTLRDIAIALSARGIQTARGNTDWKPAQVARLIAR